MPGVFYVIKYPKLCYYYKLTEQKMGLCVCVCVCYKTHLCWVHTPAWHARWIGQAPWPYQEWGLAGTGKTWGCCTQRCRNRHHPTWPPQTSCSQACLKENETNNKSEVSISDSHSMSVKRNLSLLNPLSTRPHQNVVWYNISWLGLLEMYQKKEKNILKKMSPHLSQLNVAIAHRNYFRQNNLWILKLATYTKIEDH